MGCEALSDVAIWVKSKGAVTCCGQGTCIETEKGNGLERVQGSTAGPG